MVLLLRLRSLLKNRAGVPAKNVLSALDLAETLWKRGSRTLLLDDANLCMRLREACSWGWNKDVFSKAERLGPLGTVSIRVCTMA